MILRQIARHEAITALKRDLLASRAVDQVASDCALLRHAIWVLSRGNRPVHILRLLNWASSFDLSTDARERLRESLGELAAAGDVAELSNGRWLPAPTREVRLGTADDARLVVGGLPTFFLPGELGLRLDHNGPFRRTKGSWVTDQLLLPSQELESWLGDAPNDLAEWTEAALDGEYETWRQDAGSARIYAPELYQGRTPQANRWTDRIEKLSGRYLCQVFTFGLKRYYAVQIVGGKLTRLASLMSQDFRRLMYGLDLRAGTSVVASARIGADEVRLILKSELPRPEQRYFGALGRLTFPEDKYYPRTWHFPIRYFNDVKNRLAGLGIELQMGAQI